MKQSELDILEIVRDTLHSPLCNPLETGFRHSPLTPKEREQRYSEACSVSYILLTELIKKPTKDD